jgi:hypothetical protein
MANFVATILHFLYTIITGRVWVESEFDGHNATCGPNALGMAESWALQKYIGSPVAGKTATTVIYNRMRAKGRCDPNGASLLLNLNAQAVDDGFKTSVMATSAGPVRYPSLVSWATWAISRFRENAIVLIEPSRAHFLWDHIAKTGEDAGSDLAFHYLCLDAYWPGGVHPTYGDLPEGFFALDGDSNANNPVVNGVRTRIRGGSKPQFYDMGALGNAAIFELMAIYSKVPVAPPPPPAPVGPVMPANFKTFLANPNIHGWTYGVVDGFPALLCNGTYVYKGFGDWVADHPEYFYGDGANRSIPWKYNVPLGPEKPRANVEASNPAHGAGSYQDFHYIRLIWTEKDGVYVTFAIDELRYYEQKENVA